jgi:hypothetical protein
MKRLTVLIATIIVLIATSHVSAEALTLKGQTYTKYPIVLVPGVFSWDNILGMDINYFYKIEEAIEESAYSLSLSNGLTYQKTHFIPLNPWQSTEERAADLTNQLDTLMAKYNYSKVNIIAHSHGTTTSRLAIRWMVQEAKSENRSNPITSFTSIAGPHFGVPAADYYMGLNDTQQQVLSGLLDLAGDSFQLFPDFSILSGILIPMLFFMTFHSPLSPSSTEITHRKVCRQGPVLMVKEEQGKGHMPETALVWPCQPTILKRFCIIHGQEILEMAGRLH